MFIPVVKTVMLSSSLLIAGVLHRSTFVIAFSAAANSGAVETCKYESLTRTCNKNTPFLGLMWKSQVTDGLRNLATRTLEEKKNLNSSSHKNQETF